MNEAQTLTSLLGGEWRSGYGTAPCPVCQSERRKDQRALSLRGSGQILLVHCHKSGCGFRDILDAVGHTPAASQHNSADIQRQTDQQKEYKRHQLEKARALWQRAEPITGTAGETYLRNRGIVATDGDQAGEDAGQSLAQRAHRLGWKVSMLPAPEGLDWNDVLLGKEAA